MTIYTMPFINQRIPGSAVIVDVGYIQTPEQPSYIARPGTPSMHGQVFSHSIPAFYENRLSFWLDSAHNVVTGQTHSFSANVALIRLITAPASLQYQAALIGAAWQAAFIVSMRFAPYHTLKEPRRRRKRCQSS
uniref:Uncharacterized protein n=1 Tax=Spongospora subterranea TaxID=70186 RepID=A0A0H5QXH7_9EUKA|eukprot:CRZ06650.1 hypothetical protein [Spongospora subterranea]